MGEYTTNSGQRTVSRKVAGIINWVEGQSDQREESKEAVDLIDALPTEPSAEDVKVRENRLRRMAERQGLRMEKSRRRDTRALDYGTYRLVDAATNYLVAGSTSTSYGLDLDEVEAILAH